MSLAKKLLEEGGGIYRLAPAWVPRSFCRPAKRIKLHPDDYYVLGLERGGIDERWFASTTHADNGPDTPADEGLSYVVSKDGSERMLLVDAVSELRGELIGEGLFAKYGKDAKNTGAAESQIALFTFRINHLTEHLKKNRKDFGTERALTLLVGKRRSMLDYLKAKDIERYRAIIKELGIRK